MNTRRHTRKVLKIRLGILKEESREAAAEIFIFRSNKQLTVVFLQLIGNGDVDFDWNTSIGKIISHNWTVMKAGLERSNASGLRAAIAFLFGIDSLNQDDGNTEDLKKGENTRSKADEAEMLMSQMHDLSFMLESNLSVPQKIESFSSSSKD
uniref:Uncharacterized protein n=1 Tax=Salix viminalis TaxID=40686 RepID=A0A6N2N0T3_SALVM